MTSNPKDIVCITHECHVSTLQISFSDENFYRCKLCSRKLQEETLTRVFTLKNPFKPVKYITHDLALIPSNGNFLEDFKNKTGLHIGIVNNSGSVIQFNEDGFSHFDLSQDGRWQQCLPLNFFENLCIRNNDTTIQREVLVAAWNQEFRNIHIDKDKWTQEAYHGDNNNCFNFVLTFLTKFGDNELLCNHRNLIIPDKSLFCEQYVAPIIKPAVRYIALCRKLQADERLVDININETSETI